MLDKPNDTASGCRITVRNGAETTTFAMERNDLLLMGALEKGINWPHSCRVGTCGRCKTKLTCGKISPLVDFALSPLTNRDLKSGYVLACQSKVRGDLEVEVGLLDHRVLLPRSIPGTITGWRMLSGEVIDLTITLEQPLIYEAGQYAALALAGSFVRRSFSFAGPPSGPEGTRQISFLIRHLPGGRFSGWLARQDRTGMRIWVEAPFGQMGLDDAPRDALCIAGGTGIAPILSIAAERLARLPDNRITIVFGVRQARDLFVMDRLAELQASGRVRVIPILSHEPEGSGWSGARGWVTDALTPDLGVDFAQASAFVCGSLPMVEAVEERLMALGADLRRIHADKFQPSGL
ncbi:MAG: 2Fe-2S iron-sulfur cluster binding domain-containing protein [Paracoccaceae bacterium]